MFFYKLHRSRAENYELVLGICDKELAGKELRKNPKFMVSRDFYCDKECNEEEAIKLMKKCTIANLVGKNIVKLALEKNFITKENLILIEGIPHAQFFK
ncbi:MAG: DUF424 domain-containing protein [Candidatus Aenigmarchaeota archaeon CG_4_9_14_3_um_filter_37_18]|nr:DUF424 family protein [Candidatus Aenigmarchaeota archaeon]PJB74673.1 MAG: DUF424 domain-containing protein [Candidatus Aenigmarchaeota archaeon CG_4_9_14_3_um_filter_37_18]